MPDATDTIRPPLDAELVAEIDDAIREHVRIPPAHFSVGDRVGVLREEYRAAGERVDELEEALASREPPRSRRSSSLGPAPQRRAPDASTRRIKKVILTEQLGVKPVGVLSKE